METNTTRGIISLNSCLPFPTSTMIKDFKMYRNGRNFEDCYEDFIIV